MKDYLTFLLSTILLLFLFGCQTAEKRGSLSADRPIRIVVTTGMLVDAVEQIGGEHFQVTPLMGPGVDPHLYKASEGDVTLLDQADVIVYNGLHLEGKMGEIFEKMKRLKPVIAAGELLPDSLLVSPPEFQGQHDPHIWFDLHLWSLMIERLGEQLSEIVPARREDIRNNTLAYASEVQRLHQEVRERIAAIPREQRVLITAHDAFGYFGRAYDIEVRGLQGISTVSEYGLLDVTELVDFIVARRIKAIFVESSVPTKSIEAVQSGANAKGHAVAIGGTLYSDAMGGKESSEGTYLGMVRYNVDTIVKALK